MYPGVSALNPSGICGGTTVVLYHDNSGETDPADPADAKKGDDIDEISFLPFPLVAISIWDPTYGVDVTYGTDSVFSAVK